MFSAKRLTIVGLLLLVLALGSTALAFAGVESFRYLIYGSWLSGVVVVVIGLVGVITGKIRNDLNK